MLLYYFSSECNLNLIHLLFINYLSFFFSIYADFKIFYSQSYTISNQVNLNIHFKSVLIFLAH